jgi:hypothetical protein
LDDATCLYGEITVLATQPTIYYCGANWHPGEPAGGYCGIQHNSDTERRSIFSIWDTSKELHPTVTFASPDTQHGRFGGEGEGGHTHLVWNWKVGETFQFYVRKHPGQVPNSTDTDYYIFDRQKHGWLHSASISSPNGDAKSVATIGGGIASFLENFSGQHRADAKLALYNLWLGHKASDLERLTVAHGDGLWGQMGNAYYLAEGSPENLKRVFDQAVPQWGNLRDGTLAPKLNPLKPKRLSKQLLRALESLANS